MECPIPATDRSWPRRDQDTTMASPPEKNAALVQQFLTAVVAGEDTDSVNAFLTDDVDGRNLVFDDEQGQQSVIALGERVLAGANVAVAVEDVVATDDHVAVRATVTGTCCKSPVDGIPTGESFVIACAWFCRIENGQIAEIWSLPDGLGLMEQLGVGHERLSNRQQTDLTGHQ